MSVVEVYAMRIVFCEPGKYSKILDVPSNEEALKKLLGETSDHLCVITAEGSEYGFLVRSDFHFEELPANRLADNVGLIHGNFAVYYAGRNGFDDLTLQQAGEVRKRYYYPEIVTKQGEQYIVKKVSQKKYREQMGLAPKGKDGR